MLHHRLKKKVCLATLQPKAANGYKLKLPTGLAPIVAA